MSDYPQPWGKWEPKDLWGFLVLIAIVVLIANL